MRVIQDGRMRGHRHFAGVAVMTALMLAVQSGAVAVAAPSPGTSLSATKTMTGHLVRTFGWTIAKTATPAAVTRSNGESATVAYKVTLTKDGGTLSGYFDGNICVTNTGAVATQGLAISDALTKPPAKPTLATVSVSVAAHPVLAAGATFCYPYRIDVPASALTLGASYKDTATVTITNKSGPNSGPTPSTTATLPTTPGSIVNSSVNVTDTNGGSWTFSASGFQTYNKTFNCDADSGAHPNTATITQTGQSASASVSVTCLDPDVRVTKTVDHANATEGDTLVYTITVSNAGPGTAHGVTLSDTLPSGLGASIDNPTDFSLSGSVLTLNGQPLASLASGASKTVHVTGTVPASACETTLTNSATVAATNERAAQQANDTASASTAVSCAHLEVIKAGTTAAHHGDLLSYTFSVSNSGPGALHDVHVTDDHCSPVSADPISKVNDDGDALLESLGLDGSTPEIWIFGCSYTAPAHAPGEENPIHNTATATAKSASDANETATDDHSTELLHPGINVTKQPSVTQAHVGDTVTYTFTVTNTGDTPLTVTVTDPECDAGTLSAPSGDGNGNSKLDTTETWTYTCTHKVAAADGDPLHNVVTATGVDSVGGPSGTVSDTAEADVDVVHAGINVVKGADVTQASIGDTVTYTFTVTNTGDSPLTVSISDPTCDAGTLSAPTGDGNGNSKLDTTETWTYTCSHIVTASDPDPLVNTVTVTGTDSLGGQDNDTDTATVDILAPNQPPVNTVPGAQTVNEDTNLTFAGTISVSDPDAGSNPVQVTIGVVHGTLSLGGTVGLTFTTGDGTSDSTMVFTGTISAINAALNGMTYLGETNFNSTRGTEILTITTDDQGSTGTGGPLSDTDTVGITVDALNDAPVAAAKGFTVQANMKIVGLSGLLVGATDPDTGDPGYTASFTVNDVVLDSCAGGTISNVNTSAGTFDFDPPPGSLGPCTLKYRIDDTGNPAPAATSAYATITITISGPVIWFVDDSAAPGGTGRLTAPFQTIGAADAVDAASQRIFLYSGTYTQGITLNANEWLIGQGATGFGPTPFDSFFGITPPTGTIARPTISGTRPTTGGPITFGGNNGVVQGLNINPGSGLAGLVSSGMTGIGASEVSITTANAAAVSISGGSGDVILTSVNATAGTNGIVLNNFNPSGGGLFSLLGNSSGLCGGQVSPVVAPNAADCTGGTIQSMTGAGISLTSTSNVLLRRVRVTGGTSDGISASGVTGFQLVSSWISNNGDAVGEKGVELNNLLGSNAEIDNSTIEGSAEDNVFVRNTSGTALNRLTISGTTFGLNSTALGDQGLLFEANSGGANMKLTANGNRFLGERGDAIDAIAQIGQTVEAVITNNTFVNNHTNSLGGGVIVHGGGTVNFDVSNNTFGDGTAAHNVKGTVINISKSATVGTFNGRVSNNTIGTAGAVNAGSNGGAGIFLDGGGSSGSMNILVSGNQIHGYDDAGIHVIQNGQGLAVTGNTLNATFTGNTTDTPATTTGFAGIFADIGAFVTDTNAACLDIGGAGSLANDFSNGDPFNAGDIGLSEIGNVTVRLPGYGGTATNTSQVASYLLARNLNAGTTSTNISANANGYTGGGACTAPSFP